MYFPRATYTEVRVWSLIYSRIAAPLAFHELKNVSSKFNILGFLWRIFFRIFYTHSTNLNRILKNESTVVFWETLRRNGKIQTLVSGFFHYEHSGIFREEKWTRVEQDTIVDLFHNWRLWAAKAVANFLQKLHFFWRFFWCLGDLNWLSGFFLRFSDSLYHHKDS